MFQETNPIKNKNSRSMIFLIKAYIFQLMSFWAKFVFFVQKYSDESVEVPRPQHWGGFLVRPSLIEFWQGRPSRLHDRLQYTRSSDKDSWNMERLAP